MDPLTLGVIAVLLLAAVCGVVTDWRIRQRKRKALIDEDVELYAVRFSVRSELTSNGLQGATWDASVKLPFRPSQYEYGEAADEVAAVADATAWVVERIAPPA